MQRSLASRYDSLCDRMYYTVRNRLVPTLLNSQYHYRDCLRAALDGGGRWLDLGCGHGFLPPWFTAHESLNLEGWEVVGIDLDNVALARHSALTWRVRGDVERIPLGDGVVDLLTANMVLEHVQTPELLFGEARRVLRPGGHFLIHTPNAAGYATIFTNAIPRGLRAGMAHVLLGRDTNDVYPTFYRANTVSAITELAEAQGFSVEMLELVQSSAQTVRVPPLMIAEMILLRVLSDQRWERFRPCIIAMLKKV